MVIVYIRYRSPPDRGEPLSRHTATWSSRRKERVVVDVPTTIPEGRKPPLCVVDLSFREASLFPTGSASPVVNSRVRRSGMLVR